MLGRDLKNITIPTMSQNPMQQQEEKNTSNLQVQHNNMFNEKTIQNIHLFNYLIPFPSFLSKP